MTAPSTDPVDRPPLPMALLASGVPLSLLLDLVAGPHSADLLEHERAEHSGRGTVS